MYITGIAAQYIIIEETLDKELYWPLIVFFDFFILKAKAI